jgi:glycine cleavage system regulatory protein
VVRRKWRSISKEWSSSEMEPAQMALPRKKRKLDLRIWIKRSKAEVSANIKRYWKYFRADLKADLPTLFLK